MRLLLYYIVNISIFHLFFKITKTCCQEEFSFGELLKQQMNADEGALIIELTRWGIHFERQNVYPVYYKGNWPTSTLPTW